MRAIGHDQTWRKLTAAYDGERLAHALLFSGPPGVGKSIVAEDFARRIACSADNRPCGECNPCRQVEARAHPDIRIVAVAAGKKEIGVDTAREIKRFTQMRALDADTKVVLIHDADRLSVAAQNALLKTLEEPPGRSVIMLLSETPGALLPTVRSRCQRVQFAPLDDESLRAVLLQQGVEADQLEELLATAHGSPGRALAIRALIKDGEFTRLDSAIAGSETDRYVAWVNLARTLDGNESEMTARFEVLEEMLQQRLSQAARATDGNSGELDRDLRRLALIADARHLFRRTNANRPLLAEALALRMSRI